MAIDLDKIEKVPGFCPLCDSLMADKDESGEYFVCRSNPQHRIHIAKEWAKFIAKEKDISWLKWRMKVRYGKLLQGQQRR